jgi:hypothetical protein
MLARKNESRRSAGIRATCVGMYDSAAFAQIAPSATSSASCSILSRSVAR